MFNLRKPIFIIIIIDEYIPSCAPGEIVNNSACILVDICLRDTPCKNKGNCTLGSAPDEYTCYCIGYTGKNCTTGMCVFIKSVYLMSIS